MFRSRRKALFLLRAKVTDIAIQTPETLQRIKICYTSHDSMIMY